MLPHTSVTVCAFKVRELELMVEVLLFLVVEFYFLTSTEIEDDLVEDRNMLECFLKCYMLPHNHDGLIILFKYFNSF